MSLEALPGDRNWLDALTFALATLWGGRAETPAETWPTAPSDEDDRDEQDPDGGDSFPGWDAMILALMA
jgi:hypothetical protein